MDSEIALADLIIVGSDYVRQSFLAQGVSADRIFSVRYGVRPIGGDVRVRHPGSRVRFIFVGQLSQRKGVGDLVDVFARSEFLRRSAELVLVGSGVNGSDGFIRRRSRSQHITVMGAVPQGGIGTILRTADVFVLPSYIEGFALSAIEAASVGLPLAVSERVFGDANVGPEQGVMSYPAGDLDKLQAVLETLAVDGALRETLGTSAIEYAKSANWQNFSRLTSEIILSGLARRGSEA